MNDTDFRRYYHLEHYLFQEVSPRFAQQHTLSAFDFFCIIIWKANRSKSKIAGLLRRTAATADLEAAVRLLLSQVTAAASPRERLHVLVEDWKFRLPMASAILTVLYPNDFTVYDERVCQVLRDFSTVKDRVKFEAMWDGYRNYFAAVQRAAPTELSLRDKDRWLWGQSFARQLESDITNGFARAEATPESDA